MLLLPASAAAAAAAVALLPSLAGALQLTGSRFPSVLMSRVDIPTIETDAGVSLLQQRDRVLPLKQQQQLLLHPREPHWEQPWPTVSFQQQQQQEQQQQEYAAAAGQQAANDQAAAGAAQGTAATPAADSQAAVAAAALNPSLSAAPAAAGDTGSSSSLAANESAKATPTPSQETAAAEAAAAEESRFSHRESTEEAAAAGAAANAAAAAPKRHVTSVGPPLPERLAALEHRMQQTLKEARQTLNKQTGGSLPEYGEAGPLPMLCGTWQTLPESPAFAAPLEVQLFDESDASPTPALKTENPAPFVTCQWLPGKRMHVTEIRTFHLNPSLVFVERHEFNSPTGCLPEALSRVWVKKGTWSVVSQRSNPAIKTKNLTIRIEWETATAEDVQQQQQQQQQQQEGSKCPLDGDGVLLPSVSSVSVDLAKTCTLLQPAGLYSDAHATEFIIEPQDVAVSHEAIRHRRATLELVRLKTIKANLKAELRRKKLTKSQKTQVQWTPAVENVYKQTWKHFLSGSDPWTKSLCRLELLREVCFEPPALELAEKLHRMQGGVHGKYVQGALDKATCQINHLDLQLSRHPNGAEFLTAPLYPYYAPAADIISLRKVSGCNDARDIVKFKGPPKRHTAAEEEP
ncbi:hypothetical protein Esti_006144 [Eimeria stiedai]